MNKTIKNVIKANMINQYFKAATMAITKRKPMYMINAPITLVYSTCQYE